MPYPGMGTEMPDGDVIYQKLVPCWRRSYRLMKGGSEVEIVGAAVVKAAARNLRLAGGAPGLAAVATVVAEVANGSRGSAAIRDLRQIERQHRGHVHTRLLVQVGGQMIAEILSGGRPASLEPKAVAERFCDQLVRSNLFARAVPSLIGNRFTDQREAAAFERGVMSFIGDALRAEARRLTARPTGAGLRAPSIAGVRRPTSESINEPIPL
jgi:hypothetical protein